MANLHRSGTHRVLAIVVALALGLGACGSGDDGKAQGSTDTSLQLGNEAIGEDEDEASAAPLEPSYGGRIVVAVESESNTWLPGRAQLASAGMTIAMAIYDPLVALNGDGEYEPWLAESLEPNQDLTEWTLRLRDGVRFHDGTRLDAATLKWNFDTLHLAEGSQSRGGLEANHVVGMEILDERTVVYQLSAPNASLPDMLRGQVGWPVSRAAYESDPDEFGDHPVGTGPFVFDQWTRDDRLIVTRNDDYWFTAANGDLLPYLDEIEFRPLVDEESRFLTLSSDGVQVMQTLSGETARDVIGLTNERNYAANLHVGNDSGAAIINVLRAPLDDVRIRRALAFADDPNQLATVLGTEGLVPNSTGFFSEDSPWYSDTAARAYPGHGGRDVEAAAQLVEEYRQDPNRSDGRAPGDPVTISYSCPADPALLHVAQLVQGLWGEAGIEVELEQIDQATLISNAVGNPEQIPPWSGDFMVSCWRAGGGDGDPLPVLRGFFGAPESTPANFTNFTHPEIDAQLEILASTTDVAARYDAVERISTISGEEVPILWTVGTPTVVGYRDDIHGIGDWTTPSGAPGLGTPGARIWFHQAFIGR